MGIRTGNAGFKLSAPGVGRAKREKSEKPGKPGKPGGSAKPAGVPKPATPEKPGKPGKPAKPAKPAKGHRSHATSDQVLLARAIAAEARGEPYTTRVAVGAAIVNYARSTGRRLAGVIRSTFLSSNRDHNRRFYQVPSARIPDWSEHLKAAGEALEGRSPIGNRSHFVDDSIGPPKWVDPSSGRKIGRMIFYNPQSDAQDVWQLPPRFEGPLTERA